MVVALTTLRAVLELGVVLALAYWGADTATNTIGKLVVGIGAPLIGFGIWGAVDFRRAGRWAEPLRLIEELAISAAAALALYSTGATGLGWALMGLSIGYHAAVYAAGRRLLDPRPRHPAGV